VRIQLLQFRSLMVGRNRRDEGSGANGAANLPRRTTTSHLTQLFMRRMAVRSRRQIHTRSSPFRVAVSRLVQGPIPGRSRGAMTFSLTRAWCGAIAKRKIERG
jgi:hypothetical protein